MLLCPTMLVCITTQDKDKTSKKQKDLINKEFDNEQELNGFIA